MQVQIRIIEVSDKRGSTVVVGSKAVKVYGRVCYDDLCMNISWGERSEPLPSQLNVNFVCLSVCLSVCLFVVDRLDISF